MNTRETISRIRQAAKVRWMGLMPFRRRAAHDLPPVRNNVQTATAAVDDAIRGLEDQFLKIGSTLESVSSTGMELVEQGEGLISLALGQGGGEIIVEETAETIWEAVRFVEHNFRDSENLIAQLNSANAQLSRSLEAEAALAETLAPLTYMETLFRVEASRLAPEVQTMFEALVVEIARLRDNVETGFREKFQLIREIQGILNRVLSHLNDASGHARRTLESLRAELTASLAKMRKSYECNRDRDTRLAGVSRALSDATGQVVVSLQFQDALAQRVQHTRKILAEMDGRSSPMPQDGPGVCRLMRYLEQSGRVCGAQLDAMSADLTQAGSVVSSGLGEIVRHMTTLDSDCIALRDLDDVTTGVDGAIQILLDSLEDVQRLVAEAEAFAVQSFKSIEPVGGMTTHFTSFIRNLSFEIQLIGLNAEVQSAHVGQGTGLEVLSSQTSAISRQTSELSTRLAMELDDLTAGLAAMVASFRDVQERSIQFTRTLADKAAAHGASLHDYRDRALSVLMRIGELLPQLETHVNDANARADFVEIARRPLEDLRDAVVTLADCAGRLADRSGIQVESAGLVDHFLGFYTMNAEVAAHRGALGQPQAAATDPGIDLFDSDSPASGAGSEADGPNAATSDIDLWLPLPDSAVPERGPNSQPTGHDDLSLKSSGSEPIR